MGHFINRVGLLVFLAALGLGQAGCNGGSNTLTPTPVETQFISDGSAVVYSSGVSVNVNSQSFNAGETVPLAVVLNPANLPHRANLPQISEKFAGVSLIDSGNTGIGIQAPITVTIPLINRPDTHGSSQIRLLSYSDVVGNWQAENRNAVVSDDGSHATFTIEHFGIYGLFQPVPLHVEAAATRTVGKAPFSVGLSAIIDGGTPPYSVTWDFADASTGSGTAVSHLYKDPGTYHPSVEVKDADGQDAIGYINLETH